VGAGAAGLWNTVFVAFPFATSADWVAALERRGFIAAFGSACSGQDPGHSRVIEDLQLPASCQGRTVRLSSGWQTTEQDWRDLLDAIVDCAAELSGRSAGSTVVDLDAL
jgi:cysteine desulfurase